MSRSLGAGICAVTVALALSRPSGAAALQRTEPPPQELAWIGLFNAELLGWLDNQNRLDDLCVAPQGSTEWHACRAAYVEPKVAVIPVRAAPRVDAERLGEMVVVAVPDRGFRIFTSSGRVAAPFIPDLFDDDWGYGPYFHQTILAQRGLWFRVPVPVMGAGWINAEDWSERGDFAFDKTVTRREAVTQGQIITTPRGDMFVLGVENRVLRVRPEQEADVWCQAGDPPPLAPWQEIRIPFDRLFDSNGHLLIGYKYKRGC